MNARRLTLIARAQRAIIKAVAFHRDNQRVIDALNAGRRQLDAAVKFIAEGHDTLAEINMRGAAWQMEAALSMARK